MGDVPGANNHDKPESGFYWITVRQHVGTKHSTVNTRFTKLKVFCDMYSDDGYGFTYKAVTNGKRVVPYKPGQQDSCNAMGLKMAAWRNDDQRDGAEFFFDPEYFVEAPSTSDQYLCSTNDHANEKLIDTSKMAHWQIKDSEEGKYVIKYQVGDRAGNK